MTVPIDSSARHTDSVISFGWTASATVRMASTEWARTPGHNWDTASTEWARTPGHNWDTASTEWARTPGHNWDKKSLQAA